MSEEATESLVMEPPIRLVPQNSVGWIAVTEKHQVTVYPIVNAFFDTEIKKGRVIHMLGGKQQTEVNIEVRQVVCEHLKQTIDMETFRARMHLSVPDQLRAIGHMLPKSPAEQVDEAVDERG